MKQQLVPLKMERLVFEHEETVGSLLLNKLEQLGVDTTQFDEYAKHVLIGVDGSIFKIVDRFGKVLQERINTIVKPTQKIMLLPAHKAG